MHHVVLYPLLDFDFHLSVKFFVLMFQWKRKTVERLSKSLFPDQSCHDHVGFLFYNIFPYFVTILRCSTKPTKKKVALFLDGRMQKEYTNTEKYCFSFDLETIALRWSVSFKLDKILNITTIVQSRYKQRA